MSFMRQAVAMASARLSELKRNAYLPVRLRKKGWNDRLGISEWRRLNKMEGIISGLIGGIVPALIMVIVWLVTTERRLMRMETDLRWMKEEMRRCQQP